VEDVARASGLIRDCSLLGEPDSQPRRRPDETRGPRKRPSATRAFSVEQVGMFIDSMRGETRHRVSVAAGAPEAMPSRDRQRT